MARSEHIADVIVFGKRQETAGSVYPSAADYRCAVVERGVVEKDISDKLLARVGVDDGSGGDYLAELRFALKYDKGTDVVF